MTEAATMDLGRLSTDQLGRLYVDLLRRGGIVQGAPLQREWTKRPKAERMAALRQCREQASNDARALFAAHVGP